METVLVLALVLVLDLAGFDCDYDDDDENDGLWVYRSFMSFEAFHRRPSEAGVI